MKRLIYLLLTLSPFLGNGQINDIRQLISNLEPKGAISRPPTILDISIKYQEIGELRQATNYARMAVKEAIPANDTLSYVHGTLQLCALFQESNLLDSSLFRLVQLNKFRNDDLFRRSILITETALFAQVGMGDKALSRLNLYLDSNLSSYSSGDFLEVAALNRRIGKLDKALEYGLKGTGVLSNKNPQEGLKLNLEIAQTFAELGQTNQAADLLLKNLAVADSIKDAKHFLPSLFLYFNLAEDLSTRKKQSLLNKANAYVDSTLNWDLNFQFLVEQTMFDLERGRKRQALSNALNAVELAEENRAQNLLPKAYLLVAKAYALRGIGESASEYIALYDAVVTENAMKDLKSFKIAVNQLFDAQLILEQKSHENASSAINNLESELDEEQGNRKYKNYLVYFLIGIVALAIILNMYQRNQEKKE